MIFLPSSSLPSVFGHISFRSDWELVKVDFRPSFSRPCREEDYGSWDLTDLKVGGGLGWGGQAAFPACASPFLHGTRSLTSNRASQNPGGPDMSGPSAGFSGHFLVSGLLWAWVCRHTQGHGAMRPDPTVQSSVLGVRGL